MPLSEPEPTTEDLEDLYNNAPCGYISLNPRSQIVMLNQTLLDWLQQEDQALLGRPVHEILSFGSKLAFETHLAPLLRLQGFVHEIALDIVGKDGTKIPTICNAAERRDADGKHLFTRMTVFKAVDRRKFERSLLEARVKAEEAAKAEHDATTLREQFIAVLGHDLRNPLGALTAGIGLLRRLPPDDDRREKVLHEMEASIDRADRLVADVMDFAKGQLGGGFSVTRKEAADLPIVLGHVVDEVRLIQPDREIEADIAFDQIVYCDAARLGQLAANLLSNAVTHGAPEQPVKLTAYCDGDAFVLTVTNGGKPIPEDERPYLFEPFYRADFSGSKKGLGLGLFIVSQIAKAHDGKVEVESNKALTRFTFTMPLEREVTATE